MRKKIFRISVVIILVGGVVGYFVYNMFYGSAVDKSYTVVLEEGESYSVMVDKVKANMDYHVAFDFYADRIGLDRSIKPGTYTIERGMTVIEIARMLKIGNNAAVRLTINNARTLEALAGKIARQIDTDSVTMLEALRDSRLISELGYNSPEEMFSIFIPNSYEVYANIEPHELVRKMKIESDRFWNRETQRAGLERVGLTPLEVMTLASIVHEETAAVDEMPRVAGVYMNRLRDGWLLQADPTLKYALGDFSIRRVLNEHKRVDSPYNTYMYAGLPPTPIAMPDMAAIEAVLNYEEHDFYYFCARPEMDGRHNFARTLKEHNRNADAYHRELNRQNIR